MTTCVPFLFKPIKYKDELYIDGGTNGCFPIDYIKQLKTKKYFGINIILEKNEINTILDYIKMVVTIPNHSDRIRNKKKILTVICNNGGVLETINENNQDFKLELINLGYTKMKDHFIHNYKQGIYNESN